MESLFTGIDSCSLTAVFSAQILNLFIYFIVIANIFFQIDRLELSFTDSVSDFVSVYVIPDSGFRITAFTPGGRGTLRVRVN